MDRSALAVLVEGSQFDEFWENGALFPFPAQWRYFSPCELRHMDWSPLYQRTVLSLVNRCAHRVHGAMLQLVERVLSRVFERCGRLPKPVDYATPFKNVPPVTPFERMVWGFGRGLAYENSIHVPNVLRSGDPDAWVVRNVLLAFGTPSTSSDYEMETREIVLRYGALPVVRDFVEVHTPFVPGDTDFANAKVNEDPRVLQHLVRLSQVKC